MITGLLENVTIVKKKKDIKRKIFFKGIVMPLYFSIKPIGRRQEIRFEEGHEEVQATKVPLTVS